MASHFKTLAEAKKEYKNRTGVDFEKCHLTLSPVTIYNRNRKRKKKLAKPYFVGTYFEWVNL